MNTWLLILTITGISPTFKYIEFPSRELCIKAVTTLTENAGFKAVCVEGGKPILEPKTVIETIKQ